MKSIEIVALVFTAAGFWVARPAAGEQIALLVGIDHYPEPKYRLKGAVEDVARFQKLLVERFGFQERNILCLLNEDATREKVVAAFESRLIEGAGPDDAIVFYFSGHGSYVPDLDGDELDMRDEALCTYDIDGTRPETWLTDDQIDTLLGQARASNVLVIFDCCHSGTGTRYAEDPAPPPPGVTVRFMPMDFTDTLDPAQDANRGLIEKYAASRTIREKGAPAGHIFLAACAAHQKALETRSPDTGSTGGAFTIALCRALEKSDAPGTFAELNNILTPEMKAQSIRIARANFMQTPQFEGVRLDAAIRSYLAGAAAEAIADTAVASAAPAPKPAPVMPAWRPQGKIRVLLDASRTRFEEDDLLRIVAVADHDCYLRLYNICVDNRIVQILPNGYQPECFLQAGRRLVIPPDDGDWEWRLGPPFGNEMIKAVASTRPFTDADARDFEREAFRQIEQVNLRELTFRGVGGTARIAGQRKPDGEPEPDPAEFGEALLIYHVAPAAASQSPAGASQP